MASLADIRARFAAQENKTQQTSQTGGLTYPHWKIDEGQQAIVRFLPDANQDNPFFWVERAMIRLTFPGIKGGDSKEVSVQVPCMEMYGEKKFVLGLRIRVLKIWDVSIGKNVHTYSKV